jgi:hypothetical protein
MLEKRYPLEQKVLGKLGIHLQKTETRSQSLTLYKQQLKWIEDLNVRSEIVKLLQEKLGNTLGHIGIHNNFVS